MTQQHDQAPQAPQAPVAPAGYAAPAQDPGKTLGIVGFVFAFLLALVGLVLSIIAFNKSKAAGYKNNLALAGIILSSVFIVLSVIIQLTVLPALLDAANAVA